MNCAFAGLTYVRNFHIQFLEGSKGSNSKLDYGAESVVMFEFLFEKGHFQLALQTYGIHFL